MKSLWILLVAFSLCGCSLLPKLSMSMTNTVPQTITESLDTVKCAGEIKFDTDGNVAYCSKGFYHQDKDNARQERKMTWLEQFGNFIGHLKVWIFIILVGLALLCPGVLGWLIGRVFNASKVALTEIMTAIAKFRKSSPSKEELDNILRSETSTKTKQIVNTFRATTTVVPAPTAGS